MAVNDARRYFNLAKRAFIAAEDGLLEYRTMPLGSFQPQDEANHAKLSKMGDIYDQSCVCQVFSALYVEASINQFGAIGLGERYYLDHLEKFDPKSKILVVLRLLDGNVIDKSGAYYCNLVALFKTRNDIVHHKSKPDEKHTADPEIPFGVTKKCFMAACETGKLFCNRDAPPMFLGSEAYDYKHRI